MSDKTALLRHSVAVIAYRGGKALRNAPQDFGKYQASEGTRTPGQILAHVNDLFDWATGLVRNQHVWNASEPLPWDEEVARFFRGLESLDEALLNADPPTTPFEGLLQGPIADSLTHIGQLGMLRRMAGSPVKGENYFTAQIEAGRLAYDALAAPRVEFD
jgi:hypothetical protein